MYQWILPSLREILAASQLQTTDTSAAKAEEQWRVSLAATEQLLINTLSANSSDDKQGLVITAPTPLLSQPMLSHQLQRVTFTAQPFNPLALMPFQHCQGTLTSIPQESVLSLLPADPLAQERFCLVFTSKFCLVLVLTEDEGGNKTFSFSLEPDVVELAWRSLGGRIILTNTQLFAELDSLVQNYFQVSPDHRILIQFSQLLLEKLTPRTDKKEIFRDITEKLEDEARKETHKYTDAPLDVELLQAFAHEVRTPLSTIRTLTRLLLKRRDLPATVSNRLEVIDHECTEQIDRMELLFKAAELETDIAVKSRPTELTPTSLDNVLHQSIPRWQQAAQRRNLTLDVVLPQQLPMVVSNPNMLDQVLTGLMENFTRSLPPGSHIEVQVIRAGDQLKLQLSPKQGSEGSTASMPINPPIRRALGQLLMLQPETGTISLNLAATKHLFQAIGGKLIVRQRPENGEVLTIFLPLEVSDGRLLE